jgi:hypothetical protein
MIEPISDLERRLDSIALTYAKQRHFGEKPDMNFHAAARLLGLDDNEQIAHIRRRGTARWKLSKRRGGKCIFEEADRIARLKQP